MKTSNFTVFIALLTLVFTTACSQEKNSDSEIISNRKTAIVSNQPIDFPELVSLEDILSKAKKEDKNCLIYFSGYACVNARKFEDQVLNKAEIKQLIKENFVYAVAYVDDKLKEPGQTETKGERYAKLQKEYFNSIGQPMLYIFNPDGKLAVVWSYANGTDTFEDLLKGSIQK
jgi:thioredoxin-related protein